MAVEARQMNSLFSPSQIISNRDFNKPQVNMNNPRIDIGFPMNAVRPDFFPPYGQPSLLCDPISSMNNNKSDSGVTYNVVNPAAVSKKRLRDDGFTAGEPDGFPAFQKQRTASFVSLIDQDAIYQIQQQQFDINQFISQHTEKMRVELEERRRRQTRMLMSSVETAVAKKLQEKEDEIQRMAKLNWALQERVKGLYAENQVWRDLAQSNEAAATSLRSNLEQVLAGTAAGNDIGTAKSSCGSCDGHVADETEEVEIESRNNKGSLAGEASRRLPAVSNGGGCRRCGERVASVLLLPCRHLCLCTACGSGLLRDCPVCGTVMNASVHINLS